MSAIPTADEMWKAFEEGRARRGVFLDGIQTIHALVASRVTVQEKPVVVSSIPTVEEINDLLPTNDCLELHGPAGWQIRNDTCEAIHALVASRVVELDCAVRKDDPMYLVGNRLAALKRSMETGSGE
jgi:hypothetical protein